MRMGLAWTTYKECFISEYCATFSIFLASVLSTEKSYSCFTHDGSSWEHPWGPHSLAEGNSVWQPGSGLLRDGSPPTPIRLILQSTLLWPRSYVKTVRSECYLNGAQGLTACAVYAMHWKLYSCILGMGRRKKGRGAEITRKEGNVPAKASHYTLAKQHFFNCHSSRG